MSEWVDFAVYAVQGVLFWVFLPRQGRQFGAPMIADRSPDWLAAHPEMVRYLKNSTGFLKIWYAWAATSIAFLLAVRLGWRPFGSTDPSWEVLQAWHALLLILGMAGWFASLGLWLRWLKRNVPLADRRSATLRPRTTAEYLSLPWRVTVEAFTALHLAAWVVVGVTSTGLVPNYWGKFAFVVGMTALFAAFALLVPRRRPGYPDRIFGDVYRRVEMRVAYVLRLSPIVAGVMTLGEQLTGGEFDRAGYLAVVLLTNGLLATFVFLRPAEPGRGGMIGSPFGSNMPDSPRAL